MGRMANKTHTATIHTNHGDIVVNLFGDHVQTAIRMLELGTAMVKER